MLRPRDGHARPSLCDGARCRTAESRDIFESARSRRRELYDVVKDAPPGTSFSYSGLMQTLAITDPPPPPSRRLCDKRVALARHRSQWEGRAGAEQVPPARARRLSRGEHAALGPGDPAWRRLLARGRLRHEHRCETLGDCRHGLAVGLVARLSLNDTVSGPE